MQREKEKERAVEGGESGLEDFVQKTGFAYKNRYVSSVPILDYIEKMHSTVEHGLRVEG